MRRFLAIRYLKENKGTLKRGYYNVFFSYKKYKGRTLKCYQVHNGRRYVNVDIAHFKPIY